MKGGRKMTQLKAYDKIIEALEKGFTSDEARVQALKNILKKVYKSA